MKQPIQEALLLGLSISAAVIAIRTFANTWWLETLALIAASVVLMAAHYTLRRRTVQPRLPQRRPPTDPFAREADLRWTGLSEGEGGASPDQRPTSRRNEKP